MAYNFPEGEKNILEFWKKNEIFKKSLEKTKDKKPFVFYDGPPFATGSPHYGHLMQSAIKDVVPRYKTMRGFYVERQWGWDCHGLPIENIVEKELGTKSKKDILEMGVKKFNDLCREKIFTFINEWERVIPRFGRWADMENPYRTMDFEYMQSEWWAFKELYKKGLIYEGYRSMHICPRCETTLSQGEVADGYKDIKDFSVTVEFELVDRPNNFVLAWTTTPWTLPGNVALAVGRDIEYATIEKKDMGSGKLIRFIVAKEKVEELFGGQEYSVITTEKGSNLVGMSYIPLFDYYANDENLKNRENGWKIYAADFVTAQDGTGIAHEAPAFGADDWKLLEEFNLPFVQHVRMDGIFKSEVKDFAGEDLKPRAKDKPEEVREADIKMIKFLEGKGKVFEYKKYEHSYPHCWRCDTALLNYATSSWFVAVEKIKPALLKNAKKINWSPEHIKEGRFGQWLEGARDWSISRQRFWANTIPIWKCSQCKKEIVFASAKELEDASSQKVEDLHKEFVDEIKFACSCDGRFERIPDVLDTWFDSGSVPFAALHYPLENKKEVEKRLPADFIGEAQDQTRAWFYYQHVLSGALFGKEAFKNCIVTGIILAEDGKKMSKKLKNYPDPTYMLDKYGADAVRLYILSSSVVQGENLFFSEKSVDEILKKNLGRLQNVLEFYKLYEDGTLPKENSKNILDRWILMRLEKTLQNSTNGYESYNLPMATRPIFDFVDDLSVWYVRRSRDRFKEDGQDKKDALATLRYVLLEFSKIIAPSMPFFADYLFMSVKQDKDQESVHLESWPSLNKKLLDNKLEESMKEARDIVTLALAQRAVKAIKVRQPLSLLKVNRKKYKGLNEDLLNIIKDEINVKEVLFDDKIEGDIELDINITEELKEEGIIRDIIREAQEARKSLLLNPSNKANMIIDLSKDLKDLVSKNKEYLMKELRLNEIMVNSLSEDNKAPSYFIKIEKIN
ncbi:MAG: hypothetical protein A3D35_00675 [Candidatus Staskawiczbacteria bacterium RIFCSPHIGHO2_02_FULL_34_9]|uniref:Isoleucine--tRNA ligase n=1 Tax=Candidatus Staskawiczbacteria bacterium RIFCSPHIGHO2_02_FULL_34_9 TaxID=1802206 RepID=A0A1G2I0D8_9BACT|nr:MAG: hypothetical protein A3D35_00675 [Candidatus Staskawiczbacteria bacterium RIFCSPHIGHO2_02_FULL_34_9]